MCGGGARGGLKGGLGGLKGGRAVTDITRKQCAWSQTELHMSPASDHDSFLWFRLAWMYTKTGIYGSV